MARRNLVHEGDSTVLYEGPESGIYIQYFKDDGNDVPHEKEKEVAGKGVLNNRISLYLMNKLDDIGVPTHAIQPLNMREQIIYELDMLPFKVVVRNFAYGNICKRLGLEEGEKLPYPIIEYFSANNDLHAPLVNEDHIEMMEWASDEELEEISETTLRINDFLTGLFLGTGMRLVDLKLEFGRFWREDLDYILVLGDVLTPDTCRLVDIKESDKNGKIQILRNDMKAYQDVAKRLGVLPDQPLVNDSSVANHNIKLDKNNVPVPQGNVRKFYKKKER